MATKAGVSYSITARYAGSANFASSSSAPASALTPALPSGQARFVFPQKMLVDFVRVTAYDGELPPEQSPSPSPSASPSSPAPTTQAPAPPPDEPPSIACDRPEVP